MHPLLSQVTEILSDIERAENVRILYACESGSRAWGFPSQDSDYDVRFLYLHPPRWYLSVAEKRRDVIELPIADDMDVNGWELRKALRLFRKSNPPLMEWLQSPIVYQERFSTAQRLRDLMAQYYSYTTSSYHYLHMAEGNYRDYLRSDEVWVKKYFYVLRPILAILWIEQGLGAAPTDFNVILEGVEIPRPVREAIRKLVEEKKAGAEMRHGPRNALLNEFIETELTRLRANRPAYPRPPAPVQLLDDLFLASLAEVWGFAM